MSDKTTTVQVPMPLSHFALWLARGERGLSSEAMVSVFTGEILGRYSFGGPANNHPRDPADFRRCEVLLRAYPLARLHLPLMKHHGGVWSRLVDEWDDLVALMESEAPGAFDSSSTRWRAAKTYDRIQAIIEAGRAADCDARAERGAA